MKTYKDLYITGSEKQLSVFKERIEKFLTDGWIKGTDMRFIDDSIQLLYTGDVHPKASLFIYTAKTNDGKFEVTNIVPTEKQELSFDEYNGLLMHCYSSCLQACMDETGVNIEVTSSEVTLENYMSSEAATKLRLFSAAANKSTGSGHPLDGERWNDFICQCFRDKETGVLSILDRWLIEEENWSDDITSDLVIAYEQGIILLEYYVGKYNDKEKY